MASFKAQFVGRFAYLFTPDQNAIIVAPKMESFRPHLASLVIPARFVDAGDDHAQRMVSIPGKRAASWVVWDLQGIDVEFIDYQGGGVTHTLVDPNGSTPGVADLLTLSPGQINPALRARQVKSDLMTARVTIGGGKLSPAETEALDPDEDDAQYAFKAFDDLTSVAKDATVSLVDAVQWDGQTVAPTKDKPLGIRGLTIRLHSFDGSSDRTIRCRPHNDLVLGFAHTCNCATLANRDEEFAAYYSLLTTPPPMSDRKIPVIKSTQEGALIFGGSPDCQGIVKATLS
jgi:hypothetical protein